MLQELYEWMQQRKTQQLSFPVDDASKNALGVVLGNGAGSGATTQSVAVSSTPTNINVPAAYTGYINIVVDGGQYKIPYI